ncbi:hypothetical protein HMPREF1624_01509 [Sporothrix schenckii ATCC 58251]|uniref:AAA+ ATPase domain-containing protein n=1 Tax=Sporothrix schenckii (strain ATCC 58251 / de Perez 2211183) TaxID=1391915 RepID=U7Q5T5_SPOS1|nr:hypothetical protein HMPREF1624_01509 [Sporothrix schenckii ATCC 58251]
MIARSSSPSSFYPAVRRGLVRRPTPLRRRPLPPQAPAGFPALNSPTTIPATICARCLQTKAGSSVRPISTPKYGATPSSTLSPTASSPLTRARIGQQRQHASIATATEVNTAQATRDDIGPLQEYDRRVEAGRLRNDEHQRGIIQSLQHMHDELRHYHAPDVVHPDIESLQPQPKSFMGSLFGGGGPKQAALGKIPENLPQGLYLYGDVGSGKTMLMDLFYDTLPSAVRSKTRIHFHNFMQDVHKRLHQMKMKYGNEIDAVPFVAADIAEQGNVLCFDEFQCTDVADAMILRRLLEALMSHGVVLVTTSNREPDELYKNGIQRESFIPAIELLKRRLHVINLDSPTDYRKIPRPPSGVYHTPLDSHAASHAEKWFRFLGDREHPEPHPEVQKVWGREIHVPRVSGRCAWFTFDELIGKPTSAADYLELVRAYDAFIVTDVPGMTHRQRDLARRLITFIDAVYEAQAKLVLTTAVPLNQLFVSKDEIIDTLTKQGQSTNESIEHLVDGMEGHNMMAELKHSNLFTGEEEAFAFGRALSRLTQMGSKEWVERGMGLESQGGKPEHDNWTKTRSRQMEDSM